MMEPVVYITDDMISRWAWDDNMKHPFFINPLTPNEYYCIFRVNGVWLRLHTTIHQSQRIIVVCEWKLFSPDWKIFGGKHRTSTPVLADPDEFWRALPMRGLIRLVSKEIGVSRKELFKAFRNGESNFHSVGYKYEIERQKKIPVSREQFEFEMLLALSELKYRQKGRY